MWLKKVLVCLIEYPIYELLHFLGLDWVIGALWPLPVGMADGIVIPIARLLKLTKRGVLKQLSKRGALPHKFDDDNAPRWGQPHNYHDRLTNDSVIRVAREQIRNKPSEKKGPGTVESLPTKACKHTFDDHHQGFDGAFTPIIPYALWALTTPSKLRFTFGHFPNNPFLFVRELLGLSFLGVIVGP